MKGANREKTHQKYKFEEESEGNGSLKETKIGVGKG